jgi:hypothetical protein
MVSISAKKQSASDDSSFGTLFFSVPTMQKRFFSFLLTNARHRRQGTLAAIETQYQQALKKRAGDHSRQP